MQYGKNVVALANYQLTGFSLASKISANRIVGLSAGTVFAIFHRRLQVMAGPDGGTVSCIRRCLIRCKATRSTQSIWTTPGVTVHYRSSAEKMTNKSMSNPFFDHPILNSPYECPWRHWELDESGQPTQKTVETRRRAEFITPIPKAKKQKSALKQDALLFDEGLSTQAQQYAHTAIINGVRQEVDARREQSRQLRSLGLCRVQQND